MDTSRIFALSFLAAALFAPMGAGQELLPSSGKTRYTDIQIAPSKNEIIAIARIPVTDQPANAALQQFITSLHFFDRKAKARTELTPSVQKEGGWCELESMAFSPDGKKFLVGGMHFFAGWRNPERTVWFMRWGTTTFDHSQITQLAPAKRGTLVALVRSRTYNGTSGVAREAKVTLWDNGLEDDILVETLPGRELPPTIAAALSNDGNFLAYHHMEKKKLTVVDVTEEAFVLKKKQHATFDLNLPDVVIHGGRPSICFAHDNGAVWVLCREKLYSFDLRLKKAREPIEFKGQPFGMHVLADGSYILVAEIQGDGNERKTILNLFGPKSQKVEKRVPLEKLVDTITVSSDDSLLAGSGETGIYLWDVPALLRKAERAK